MTTGKDKVLVRLAMDHKDIVISGMAGEFCASWVFDKAQVAWIDLGQEPNHQSSFLKAQGAHRPDYLVAWGGASLLLDVKTYKSLSRDSGGNRRFGLVDDECARLQKTASITGLPVALLFWDKLEHGRFSFGLCLIDDLKGTHVDADQRRWKCIDFTAAEMTTLMP